MNKEAEIILKEFEKEKINYCILRNYWQKNHKGDIDILLENRKNIEKIMKKFGFEKGIDFKNYLCYKKKNLWFDFRVGCLPYAGFCFEKAKDLLKNKKKKGFLFTLSKEDETIHLILHSILDKGFFKEEYKKRIERLLKELDLIKIRIKLIKKFKKQGRKLFFLIEKREYCSASKLRKKLFFKIFRLKDLFQIILIKILKERGKQKLNKSLKET